MSERETPPGSVRLLAFPGPLGRWRRLRSYLDSAAAHGISTLDAISSAIARKPWLLPLPATKLTPGPAPPWMDTPTSVGDPCPKLLVAASSSASVVVKMQVRLRQQVTQEEPHPSDFHATLHRRLIHSPICGNVENAATHT